VPHKDDPTLNKDVSAACEADHQPETPDITPDAGSEQAAQSCENSENTGPEAEIARLTQALSEQNDRYLRLLAEYDNYRKRTQKERENLYGDVQALTLSGFLPLADNFARAMEAPTTDPEFKKGMALIQTGLEEIFSRFGVEPFGTVGEVFDPAIHEAVARMDSDEAETDCVCAVFSTGYRMGERILRPARVAVAN
jgi:molecular chaperone GrpE